MSDKNAQKTLALIRLNLRRLEACAGHEFAEIAESSFAPAVFGIEVFVRCAHCAGEITADGARWYERGLEHGRRRPSRR